MDPYYRDPDVLIYHADLREVLDLEAVACVVTSPPYNSGVSYDVHNDAMADEDYRDLASVATGLMASALGPERGRAWVNVGVTQLHLWLDALRQAGFDRSTTVAWDYGLSTADTAWGFLAVALRPASPLRLRARYLRLGGKVEAHGSGRLGELA